MLLYVLLLCYFYLYSDACTTNVNFPRVLGRTWLNYVICSGSEETIADCTTLHWSTNNEYCHYSQIAAVVCKTSGKTLSSLAYFHPMQLLSLLNIALH